MNSPTKILVTAVLILAMVSSAFCIGIADADESGARGGGDAIDVPTEGMVIVNGTYYGISKTWYEENSSSNEVLSISLKIPSHVTAILKDGFRDNWTNDKQKKGVITNYNGDPEVAAAGAGAVGSSSVGIDYCCVPATASFSFGVNLTF